MSLDRIYTWGLDLTGSLTASGGVGALLQVYDALYSSGMTLLATYDGNGNVTAMVDDDDGSLEATYEYDPFGGYLRKDGDYADENPFRFSTKYTDEETDLVYYGLRYYSPSLGRFINRDPIEEQGGINLYSFVGNDAINAWDYLGLTHHAIASTTFVSGGSSPIYPPGIFDNPNYTGGGNGGNLTFSISFTPGGFGGFGSFGGFGGEIISTPTPLGLGPRIPGINPLPGDGYPGAVFNRNGDYIGQYIPRTPVTPVTPTVPPVTPPVTPVTPVVVPDVTADLANSTGGSPVVQNDAPNYASSNAGGIMDTLNRGVYSITHSWVFAFVPGQTAWNRYLDSGGTDTRSGVIAGVEMASNFVSLGLLKAYQSSTMALRNTFQVTESGVTLSNQALRGIRPLEKQIAKHKAKLAEFIKNPTVRPGMERQSRTVIEAAQRARIRHLQREIDAFRGNIEKLRKGGG